MSIASAKRVVLGLVSPSFQRLPFRRRAVVTGWFLLAMLLTTPLWFASGELLATVFAIDTAQAIRDQRGGWWWFACWMSTVVLFIASAWLMALSALAYRAHRRGELSGDEAIALALYSEYPRSWFYTEGSDA